MRPYIDRYLFGIGIAVAVVLALCLAWPVDDGVTQADDGAILTVGACIGASAKGDSLQEVLIEKGVIEEDLLQTRVTSGMCEDMLDSGGTPAQKLVAAQNYVQEIELIEGAMQEAAGETATRAPA